MDRCSSRRAIESFASEMSEIESKTQIRLAIKQGNLEEVTQLINSNPGLRDVMTPFGTWLHVAASAGQLDVVKQLVRAGMDINRQGGIAGGNALTEAAEEGHLEVVEYLLDEGSSMLLAESEWNPLFAAIQAGNAAIVRLLLERGIDATVAYSGPTVKDFDAYAFAMEQGQKEIAAHIKSWLERNA